MTSLSFTAIHRNRQVDRSARFLADLESSLPRQAIDAARQTITAWPGYKVSPLVDLVGLAASLGLGQLLYKDESERFGLGSFKALGGAYAVYCTLRRDLIQRGVATEDITLEALLTKSFGDLTKRITITCATDGNHGRSVAWGARLFGCRCVVFLHEQVSPGRALAIEDLGAEIVRCRGNYDDSVRAAATRAAAEGWIVVSDTSYSGYEDIPRDVMAGYTVMTAEIARQLPNGKFPTHVILQGGVGGMAAAVLGHLCLLSGEARPIFIVVEPDKADCLYQSAMRGRMVSVMGALETIMAGLACGDPSPLAWKILSSGVDVFASIPDDGIAPAMRLLARGTAGDPSLVAGESAVAGLAFLLALTADPAAAQAIGIGPQSRVLLIGTEGDTDPDLYHAIVGSDPENQ